MSMDYNPFSYALQDDPFPTYRYLRDEAPLYRHPQIGFWAISRFQDVWTAFGDWQTYSSALGTTPGAGPRRRNMLSMDPPEATRLRNLVSKAFTPRRIAALEPTIRQLCGQYLDPLVGAGSCDVVEQFSAVVPMDVISSMLGIPPGDREAVREAGNRLSELGDGSMERTPRASEAEELLCDYFAAQVLEHRRRPRDDVMSGLIEAELPGVDRRQLDEDEILAFCVLLAGAGNETLTKLIANAIVLLHRHPAHRARLVAEPGLLPQAIEEILRYDGVAHYQARTVMRDVELYGDCVPKGSMMILVQGAAQRDEREYPDPDRLDFDRGLKRQLAFGYGQHVCLGASLARLEARVMLEEFLARIPEYAVDESRLVRARTANLRGYASVPLTY